MRLVCFVDGDNHPPTGTTGIEKLGPEDEVRIFYAKNNSYYGNQKKRDELKQVAHCQLEFEAVDPGKNATDFAVAIAAAKRCSEDRAKCEENMYLLVSQDKHFDLIQNNLALAYSIKGQTKRVDDLEEGISRYFLFKAESKEGLMKILERQFGKKVGQMLCGQIEKIFADCNAEDRDDKVDLKKRMADFCKGRWKMPSREKPKRTEV